VQTIPPADDAGKVRKQVRSERDERKEVCNKRKRRNSQNATIEAESICSLRALRWMKTTHNPE